MSYTTKEISLVLGTSERYVQKKCKEFNIPKKKNKYLITDEVLKLLQANETNEQTHQTNEQANETNEQANVQIDLQVQSLEIENERLKAENKGLKQRLKEFEVLENERIEVFTEDDYQEFQKRLIKYPGLLEDLKYHRKSSESHQRQMEMILRITEQKNYIEAKNKNYDKI